MTAEAAVRSDYARFRWAGFRDRPGLMTGIFFALALRFLFGFFFLRAGWNKIRNDWPWSDKLQTVFTERLAELEPGTFGALFLEKFGIPFYLPIAWVVTVAELIAGFCLLFGVATRLGAGLTFWLMFMFAIGGYYDASLLPLLAVALLLVALPTGHWFGLDRQLHARYPGSIWFR